MNVMAQAHKLTRDYIKNAGQFVLQLTTYKELFKSALKQAHKEFKAMQAEKNDQIQDMIFQAETFIAKLEKQLILAKGYVVTVGELRVCVNAEVGHLANVLNMPNYEHVEDARYYATRVKNAKKETGQVEVWADRIRWEIQQQKNMIETLKNT